MWTRWSLDRRPSVGAILDGFQDPVCCVQLRNSIFEGERYPKTKKTKKTGAANRLQRIKLRVCKACVWWKFLWRNFDSLIVIHFLDLWDSLCCVSRSSETWSSEIAALVLKNALSDLTRNLGVSFSTFGAAVDLMKVPALGPIFGFSWRKGRKIVQLNEGIWKMGKKREQRDAWGCCY